MIKKKFIAYFDILGYESRIKGKSLEQEFKIQERLIKDREELIDTTRELVKCQTIHFSDTHILYTNDCSNSSFSKIIRSSLLFMLLAAVRNVPYLPMRGAISYGDFLVDAEKKIIIGGGLRDACGLEKAQEWMGCCLSDLCYEQVKDYISFKWFLEKRVLVKYRVPFKSKEKYKYAVNMESFPRIWGKRTKEMPITDSRFIENIFRNKGMSNKDLLKLDKKVRIKLKNTQKFFRYIEKVGND
ncbi:MAG: hypothetical protein ACYSSI_05030 [Planctomycetota bacterium]|jgi:hypothetical protein